MDGLIASILSDARFSRIQNGEILRRTLQKPTTRLSAVAEAKVAFWLIDKGVHEIEYEPLRAERPDFRVRMGDISFCAEVKRTGLSPGDTTVTESGIKLTSWQFGEKGRRRIHNALRKAKKGEYELYCSSSFKYRNVAS